MLAKQSKHGWFIGCTIGGHSNTQVNSVISKRVGIENMIRKIMCISRIYDFSPSLYDCINKASKSVYEKIKIKIQHQGFSLECGRF